MRQAGNPSSVDRLRMREMLVFKRTIPGKSPARRIAAERYPQAEKNDQHLLNLIDYNFVIRVFYDIDINDFIGILK